MHAEAGSFGNFLLNRFGVGKVKIFLRASREEMRPWKKVFDLDIRELEAEWLRALDTAGKVPEDQVEFLASLWKQNPKTACTRAEKVAAKN